MARKFFRKMMPPVHEVRDSKHLRIFGRLLHDGNLWHLNRRSVSGAFGLGLFAAFIPIPFQMILAAALAIIARVNLPIAVALVWLTNPLTMVPVAYVAYKLGALTLGLPPQEFAFNASVDWLMAQMDHLWLPLLVGSLMISLISGILGFVGVRLFWRLHVAFHMRQRRRRAARQPAQPVE
ncbi:MAG: DUF2062 domain-containing protein [Halothiobacillaceae bacterium]|nr:DUF2062 domain-containing protein [Halothiobacillaceae bacterium]